MFFSKKVVAFVALATQVSAQQTPGLIAGYQSRTGVDDFLVRDLIEGNLESLIGDESCASLDAGRAFFLNSNPDEGGYLRSIPTYRGTKSDEWAEYTEFAGTDDYHIEWVAASFDRGQTNFDNGGANFQKLWGGIGNEGKSGNTKGGDCVGYEECVKKVTAFTYPLIESVQLMQKSIDHVKGIVAGDSGPCIWIEGCTDAVTAWDAAVAIFVGSLEGEDGNNDPAGSVGKSLYGLGDKRCPNYGTCGPNGGSIAKDKPADANSKILSLLAGGAQAAYAGLVPEMMEYKKKISQKMAIPLIQGTLRYAYKMSDENGQAFDGSDKTVGEGAAFSAGAFPKLWACSSKGFDKAFKEMGVGKGKAGKKAIKFQNVKLAFECNYACLGITCKEVGDFFNGAPFPEGPPDSQTCNDDDNGSSADKIAKCGRPSAQRRQICRKFTGQPGISSSSSSDDDVAPTFAPGSDDEAPTIAPVRADDDGSPTNAPVRADDDGSSSF